MNDEKAEVRTNHPHALRCVLRDEIVDQDSSVIAQVCEHSAYTVDLIQYQTDTNPASDTFTLTTGLGTTGNLATDATDAQVRTELETLGHAAADFEIGYVPGGGIWSIEWLDGGAGGTTITPSTGTATVDTLTGGNSFKVSRPGNKKRGQITVQPLRYKSGEAWPRGSICLATWIPGNGYAVQIECRGAGEAI